MAGGVQRLCGQSLLREIPHLQTTDARAAGHRRCLSSRSSRCPLRSLRLKALVFGRKYEKLVTAKFAKNGRQGRKERLSTSGDLDPLGCHDLRNPRGRRRVAVMWAKPGKRRSAACKLLTPVLQVTEDAFLCDLRVPFAIFAVKGSCF